MTTLKSLNEQLSNTTTLKSLNEQVPNTTSSPHDRTQIYKVTGPNTTTLKFLKGQ